MVFVGVVDMSVGYSGLVMASRTQARSRDAKKAEEGAALHRQPLRPTAAGLAAAGPHSVVKDGRGARRGAPPLGCASATGWMFRAPELRGLEASPPACGSGRGTAG